MSIDERSLLNAVVADFRARHKLPSKPVQFQTTLDIQDGVVRLKFNPYHDDHGRFTNADGAVTITAEGGTIGAPDIEGGPHIILKPGIEELEVFHGTSKQALASIYKNGLVPKGGIGADTWLRENQPYAYQIFNVAGRPAAVYMAPTPASAFAYAQLASAATNTKPLILRVVIPKKEVIKIVGDPQDPNGLKFRGRIPPEWIKEAVNVPKVHNFEAGMGAFRTRVKASNEEKDLEIYLVILVKEPDESEGQKDNPYHDELGRFTNAANAVTIHGQPVSGGAEEALRKLDLSGVDTSEDYGGSTTVHFLNDATGARRAVVKPASGLRREKLRQNIPAATDIERERAAYLLNQHLGGLVKMPTAIVAGSGADRALVLDYMDGEIGPSLSGLPTKEVDNAALFDALIGNEDRHSGNYLADPNGHLVCIDHGLTFPTGPYSYNFNDDLLSARSNPKLNETEVGLLEKLRKERSAVEKDLRPLIGDKAFKRLYSRIDQMLNTGKVIQQFNDF